MKFRIPLFAAAILLSGSLAAAALTTQGLVDDFSAQGYTRIEVKVGPTQTKVEAIRGTEKLEVVYDNATGATLKSEAGTVRPGEDTAPGVEIRNRRKDFVGGNDNSNDDDDDGSSDDDDSDDDNSGSGSDDDGDDDHGGGDDDDDDGDDDHGGDDDDDDDHGDDDHSGHGGGNSGHGGGDDD